jgi:hypothetical protein
LRFYQLSKSTTIEPNKPETIHLSETETPLQSRERWAPVVLSLEKIRLGKSSFGKVEEFKVSLAYSLPVFPNDWTVGLQGTDSFVFSRWLLTLGRRNAKKEKI